MAHTTASPGCIDTIQAGAKLLVQAGFTAAVSTTGELTSAFMVENGPLHFLYRAQCIDDTIIAESRISGLLKTLGGEKSQGLRRIYEEILRIAGRYKVSIGLSDSTILISFCASQHARSPRPITESFAFAAAIAEWLHRQAERIQAGRPVEPFGE